MPCFLNSSVWWVMDWSAGIPPELLAMLSQWLLEHSLAARALDKLGLYKQAGMVVYFIFPGSKVLFHYF